MNRKINYFLLTVFCLISLNVVAEENLQIVKMQSEMLRLISTPDKDKFTEVVEQLKAECQKQGDERMFYIAWGNQSIYEATHQNYMKAEEIVNKISEYAADQNSYWGNYIVLHTKAVNALQKQDYQEAEEGFKKAVDFRHKYFPSGSV